MRSRFKLQFGKNILAGNFGRRLLITAQTVFVGIKNFKTPPLFLRITLVHLEQNRGKQSGLVAAGTGAHFQNGVFLVFLVFRQQQDFNFLFQFRQLFLQLVIFGFRHFPHFPVHTGVFHHCLGIVQVFFRFAVMVYGFNHRPQFGQFLVHLHQVFRRYVRRRQKRRNLVVTVDNVC